MASAWGVRQWRSRGGRSFNAELGRIENSGSTGRVIERFICKIDAAARVLGGVGMRGPKLALHAGRLELFGGKRRNHTHAAHLQVQSSGHGEHGVPDRVAIQTAAAHAAEIVIVGILLQTGAIVRDACGLLVSIRKHDQTVHLLHAPSAGGELGGQPVEQLGVRGRVALAAEIVGSSHDALAEVALPDAVHNHAAQQGLVGRGEPQGQSFPALRNEQITLGFVDGRRGIERREEAGLNLFALLFEVGAGEDVGVGNDVGVGQNLSRRIMVGQRRIGRPEPFEQSGALGVRLARGRCFDGLAVILLDLPALPFPSHLLQILRLGDEGELPVVGLNVEQADQWNFALFTAGEQRVHAVIIALADGIELVIVTAGASKGESEKRRADCIDGIGLPFHAILLGVICELNGEGAEREQAGADAAVEVVALLFGQVLCAFEVEAGGPGFLVGGDLLPNEGIVRLVVVERRNDVIAVAPGGDVEVVGLEAGGVGVANQVQPVAAPTLSITGGREQAIDQFLVGVFRGVVDELGDLLRGGRQAVQIEIGAAGEHGAIGGRGWAKAFLVEPGEDEGVDRVAYPRGIFHCWNRRADRLAERPPGGRGGGRFEARARVDPVAEDGDFGGSQSGLSGRHLQVAVALYSAVEQALVGLAGDDGRSALTAFQHGGQAAEVQIRHAGGAVAAETFRVEDGRGGLFDLSGGGDGAEQDKKSRRNWPEQRTRH